MSFSTLVLSFIIASRFFSLFIVLPVISLYAREFAGATALSTGLIVGVYAIFQMIFSLPFGFLSDLIGRKKAMLLGLLIFIAGSLVCAQAASIEAMLAGRCLQGAGAIGGVATAMIADLTSEAERGKAMAIMGASIGMSFAAAMIIGPALAHFAGLASLFYVCAALSLLAILLLALLPSRPTTALKTSLKISQTHRIFSSHNLLLLYLTNFLQKGLIAAVFTLLPILYVHEFSKDSEQLYKLYGAAMALGFCAMGFGGVVGESRGKSKLVLLAGVALFGAAMLCFYEGGLGLFYAGVAAFFVALCLHEPIMQSSISKICPAALKGSAIGLSNACGYLGSFVAPLAAAVALAHGDLPVFLLGLAATCALWFLLLLALENPNDFRVLNLGWGADISRLAAIDSGENERGVWVKINTKKYPAEQIAAALGLPSSGASEHFKTTKKEQNR